MEIRVLQLIEGAKKAEGLAVIIDVFRAFSTACYAMAGGAARIVPVGDLETAFRLKREEPQALLVGERGGVMVPGFDYGNSPTQLKAADVRGKTIVHTTSAGTQGIANARMADEIITGSFVNAEAIASYIRRRKPEIVSLVCMGLGGEREADEDTLCADYIRHRLEGRTVDFSKIVARLQSANRSGSFLDLVGEASAPKDDFDLCLALDAFDFVLRVRPGRDDLAELEMIRGEAEL